MKLDDVWRSERDLMGRWIAVRYIEEKSDLSQPLHRECDVIRVRTKGFEVANYFDAIGVLRGAMQTA